MCAGTDLRFWVAVDRAQSVTGIFDHSDAVSVSQFFYLRQVRALPTKMDWENRFYGLFGATKGLLELGGCREARARITICEDDVAVYISRRIG